MIKVIDYQKIDLNDDEFKYYQSLLKQVGEDEFRDLFKTDDKGKITVITPTKPISWSVIFFLQNVMVNQNLRDNDQKIAQLEKEIKQLKAQKK